MTPRQLPPPAIARAGDDGGDDAAAAVRAPRVERRRRRRDAPLRARHADYYRAPPILLLMRAYAPRVTYFI